MLSLLCVSSLLTAGGGGTYDYTIAYDSVSEAWSVTLNNNLPATHKLFLSSLIYFDTIPAPIPITISLLIKFFCKYLIISK